MKKINNWAWQDFDILASTNDEAMSLVTKLNKNCIVSAKMQTKGRGRRAHSWISQEGNLFVSFAFRIELTDLSQIVILSAVAIFKTISHFIKNSDIKIKWPNDILINNEKISGILFEKADNDFWVMGVGINIVSNPQIENNNYKTTSFNKLGVIIDRIRVLEYFVDVFDNLLEQYNLYGFDKIKQTWLDNAYNLGNSVIIKQANDIIEGKFLTIDDNGALILQSKNEIKKIIVGDLFKKES